MDRMAGRSQKTSTQDYQVPYHNLWSAHVNAGLPFSACELPMLQCLIRGIKRYMGECERSPKLPITYDVLACILTLATHLNLSGWLNFEAATTTAFSGFLRCGEFSTHSGRNFDPSIHLTRSSVEFVPSIVTPIPRGPHHAGFKNRPI